MHYPSDENLKQPAWSMGHVGLLMFVLEPLHVLCKNITAYEKSPADWRDFLLCWHYLSSRQVALQVLSARMSLTSVFGMGTGGPSSQSIPTSLDGFYTIIYVKTLVQVLTPYLISFLVTRTGFEPMLKA